MSRLPTTIRHKTGKAGSRTARMRSAATSGAGVVTSRAAPRIEQARAWAGPRLHEARGKLTHEVKPRMTEALVSARVASAPMREETRFRAAATLAALRGQVEPRHRPKPRRRRKGVAMAGAAGAAAAWTAWSRARNRSHPGAEAPLPTVSADAAGASPDEVLADTTEPGGARH